MLGQCLRNVHIKTVFQKTYFLETFAGMERADLKNKKYRAGGNGKRTPIGHATDQRRNHNTDVFFVIHWGVDCLVGGVNNSPPAC
jgi:hypothetical protein